MVTPYALQVQPLDVGKAIGLYQQGEQEKLGDEKRQKQDQFSAALPAALATNADPSARQAALAAAPTPDQLLTLHNAFSQMDANSLQRHGQQFDQAMRVFANVKDQAGLDQGKAFLRTQKFDDPAMFEGVTMESLPHAIAMSKAAGEVAAAHLKAEETQAHIEQMKGSAAKDNAAAAAAGGPGKPKYGKPMMIDVRAPDTVGPDGKTIPGAMTTTLAQQDERTGQWVTADEKRASLGSPEGVTPPGGSGRFQVQAGRVMAAAEDVLRTVKTINALPITASTGPFGMATTKTSFFGAPLNYLRQSMSSQQVQTYNALAQGLARSVVSIENQGLAPSEGQIASAAAQLLVQPGDTYLTRIQKQAEFRQHTEAHLEPMLHGTMTTPEQKVYIRKIISDLRDAIPYSVQDIIKYNSKPDETTFGDYARRTVLRGKPQAAAIPPTPSVRQEYGGPSAPAGAVQPPMQPQQQALPTPPPSGVDFVFGPDGKLVPAK